jgi:hypothetical protein
MHAFMFQHPFPENTKFSAAKTKDEDTIEYIVAFLKAGFTAPTGMHQKKDD